MSVHPVLERLGEIRIVPVIALEDAVLAAPLARALAEGGLPAAEVTFRTPAAEEALRQIHQQVPQVCLCAGTVLTPEQAQRAVEAGAQAIVSPGTNLEVVRWCQKRGVPVIPGCATPTEMEACMREGLTVVKFFPAEAAGGVRLLKAAAGPYPGLKFMPTGGITRENAAGYLALKNVLCCGGSWLAPAGLLAAGDFAAVRRLAEEAAALAGKGARL